MNNSADTCPLYDVRPRSMARSPVTEDKDRPRDAEVNPEDIAAKNALEDRLCTSEFEV